jgi:hypothetical protein
MKQVNWAARRSYWVAADPDGTVPAEEGRHAHKICAQLLYTVTTVNLNGQWVVYFAARYTSHPTRLYKECLLYALRHFYDM